MGNKTNTPASSVEGIKMVEIPKPIGDFIIQQNDVKATETGNGYYYHYKDVVTLLGRYASQYSQDKGKEIIRLKALLQQVVTREYSECRQTDKNKQDVWNKFKEENKI